MARNDTVFVPFWRFYGAHFRAKHRWAPPNRRFVSSGLCLPSVERSGVGDIVIAVDTSGSIGTKELGQFAGEINAIASEAQPESIRVIYCDAVVQAVEEFGPSEPIKVVTQGRWGDGFRAALQVGGGGRHRAEVPHLPDRSLLQLVSSGSRLPGAVGYRNRAKPRHSEKRCASALVVDVWFRA